MTKIQKIKNLESYKIEYKIKENGELIGFLCGIWIDYYLLMEKIKKGIIITNTQYLKKGKETNVGIVKSIQDNAWFTDARGFSWNVNETKIILLTP